MYGDWHDTVTPHPATPGPAAGLQDKEAAVWLSSGTMANQVALRTLTRPGDEVVACRESHAAWHEAGGAAANAGVQIHEIGQGGCFTAEELRAATKPRNFPIFPLMTLVQVENTHNRAGGVVVPQSEVLRICAVARELGLAHSLMARGCGTQVQPVVCHCMPWLLPSTWWLLRLARGLAHPAGRCWPARQS